MQVVKHSNSTRIVHFLKKSSSPRKLDKRCPLPQGSQESEVMDHVEMLGEFPRLLPQKYGLLQIAFPFICFINIQVYTDLFFRIGDHFLPEWYTRYPRVLSLSFWQPLSLSQLLRVNALIDFDAVWNESALLIENTKICNVLVWIFIWFT